jgi:hypothetical protein
MKWSGAALADIKENSYIAATAAPQAGRLPEGGAMLIFPER